MLVDRVGLGSQLHCSLPRVQMPTAWTPIYRPPETSSPCPVLQQSEIYVANCICNFVSHLSSHLDYCLGSWLCLGTFAEGWENHYI